MIDRSRRSALAILIAIASATAAAQTATSGIFTLHKFARAIGSETYSIDTTPDTYTLKSQFKFTDRGQDVPLDTTFIANTAGMTPVSYSAKGKASRFAAMDDSIAVTGNTIAITRSGHAQTQSPSGPWFITDGYSPVAMQEQMMRWWLTHDKPAQFTVYPSGATVQIASAGPLTFNGITAHGYTVSGLIWGQECLWLDDAQNLIALVSTDAEFDHFEAVRQPYESSLGAFIGSAVQANLAALNKLTATARMAPPHTLAITGATLEDSTGAPPIKDSVILIEDGIIKAAGPRAQVSIPSEATILNATGKYAIPGLWDAHAHYEQVEWGPIYLAAGVTSVRDVGNEFDFIRTLHDELDRKQNPAIGPHLEFAGLIDGTGKYTLGAVIADTPQQAKELVDRYKAAGARQIKVYSSVKPDVLKAITAEAHKLNMTVTGHIPVDMSAIDGVNDGMDQINHIEYEVTYFAHFPNGADGKPDYKKAPTLDLNGPPVNELLSTLRSHHTVLDPTVALFESFYHIQPLDQLEPGIDHLPTQLRQALDSPPAAGDQAALATANWQAIMATLHALHAAGIPIIAGTDQDIPGYSIHREIEIYVEAGFTPLEALQAATIQTARALGVENESGSLQPGKRGDVLLLNADPLADIHNTRTVWRTIGAGAVYSPAPLWQSVDFQP